MPVLMFINIKGGVAKTTNAVAVSQFLAERGNRVLLIDADHQCAAGETVLGGDRMEEIDANRKTLHDLLSAIVKPDFCAETFGDYIVPVSDRNSDISEKFSVLPSSIRIDDYQRNYNLARQKFGSSDEFRKVVGKRLGELTTWLSQTFDYTIIDCPPSLPLQVQKMVKISDAYVVPCIPEKLSARGALYLKKRLNRKLYKLPPLGTIWSLFRIQNGLQKKMIDSVYTKRDLFHQIPPPFDTVIPNATAIVRGLESSITSKESLNTRYTRAYANTYRSLVGEIVQRCEKFGLSKKSSRRSRELSAVG